MPHFDTHLARQSLPVLLRGLEITVELTFIVIALSLILGVLVALGRLSPLRIIRLLTGAYVEFIRSTPLLLQLIYIYFVLPAIGITLSPLVAGVAGLTINYTAYLSEVYRSGIQAVPQGQRDAASALGMRPSQAFLRIVLPQAIRIVLPSLGNYFVSLFKDTSLVSVLTLRELLFSGQIIIARTFDYFTIYTMIFGFYFVVAFPASQLVRWTEKITQADYRSRRSRGKERAEVDHPVPETGQ